jgi:hypothetical protein
MHFDKPKPDLSHQLDQDADADEDVEDGEDLDHRSFERQVRVGDARRGQSRNREVESVDDRPVLVYGIGQRANDDEEQRRAEDLGEPRVAVGNLEARAKRWNMR